VIRGRKCEWCGSNVILSFHHNKHLLPYAEQYRSVSEMILKKLIQEKVYTPTSQEACPRCHSFSIYIRKKVAPKYRCIKCENTFDKPSVDPTSSISKEDWKDFQRRYKEKIKEIVDSQRQKEVEEYMALKDGAILCKRCHYYKERGKVLCHVCKTRYHKPEYGQCYECFAGTHKGKEVSSSNELLPYQHPWCDRTFMIKGDEWQEEADPQMCCINHCDVDPYSCETAAKHWEEDNET